jgi:hypothetical protein
MQNVHFFIAFKNRITFIQSIKTKTPYIFEIRKKFSLKQYDFFNLRHFHVTLT